MRLCLGSGLDYAVIDASIDTGLIVPLADSHPEWQIVMAGPVVRIGMLQRPDIHYMGRQRYEDLWKFLADWDACLLTFALNESTQS